MSNPISSPGDPIFYLHHTWLDKIWWDWQAQDLPRRLTEIEGRNRMNITDLGAGLGGFPGDAPPDSPGDLLPFPTGDSEFPPGFMARPDDVPYVRPLPVTIVRLSELTLLI